jgi:hypothetical protein
VVDVFEHTVDGIDYSNSYIETHDEYQKLASSVLISRVIYGMAE